MTDYSAHNQRVAQQMMSAFVQRKFKPKILQALREVAQIMVDTIDGAFEPYPTMSADGWIDRGGNDKFPTWTGQMHDSTGVAIYDNGRVEAYLPTQIGLAPQYLEEEGIENIIGADYLDKAIKLGASTFSKGIWIVLFSAVPYAWIIENLGSSQHRGIGFFKTLKEQLLAEVSTNLKPIMHT